MGAFLLFREDNIQLAQIEKRYASSIDVFSKKGLPLVKRFVKKDFILFLFGKNKIEILNTVEYEDSSFICGTGTFIYEHQYGQEALKGLYQDFTTSGSFLKRIRGNYAIIIFRNNNLYLFNDYEGLYHVFVNSTKTIISSSILPLVKSQEIIKIRKQEFYEYVLTGAAYGDKTVFEQIDMIDSRVIHHLSPIIRNFAKAIPAPIDFFKTTKNLNVLVSDVSNQLINFFEEVKSAFGNNLATPITGGYDSRLVYAALKKSGLKAAFGFVLKKDHQLDVQIAQQIAKYDKLKLIQLPNCFPDFRGDESLEVLKKQFYTYDGLGVGGIFQYFSGMDVWDQIPYEKLLLDGGGGEIYRNMHGLPDRKIPIKNYVNRVFNKGGHTICNEEFDADIYLRIIGEKILHTIGVKRKVLKRPEAEMIFPKFYLKYWMGCVNSLANQYSYYLTPFSDELLIQQSIQIPVKFKSGGLFEAMLIKYIDPELSKFQSNYGINFYDDLPMKVRLSNFLKENISPTFKTAIKRFISIKKQKNNLPFYSQKKYVDDSLKLDTYVKDILSKKQLEISQFIDFSKATSPAMVSRALSVEVLMSGKF